MRCTFDALALPFVPSEVEGCSRCFAWGTLLISLRANDVGQVRIGNLLTAAAPLERMDYASDACTRDAKANVRARRGTERLYTVSGVPRIGGS